MSIKTTGSFALPKVAGVEKDDASIYRIACAQVLPSENGVQGEGGLDKLEVYTKEAAKHGADEYFLTGATHDSWRAVREPENSPTSPTHPDDDPEHFLSRISDIAKENDIDIVAGTVVEMGSHHIPHRSDEPEENVNDDNGDQRAQNATTNRLDDHDQKLFNTVYYIDRNGNIAGRYTKRNLWHPEKSVLSPGHELRHEAPRTFQISTKSGKTLRAGVAVCWDLAFPETFREMFDVPPGPPSRKNPLLGPDIVFAPTCWYATDGGQKGIRWNRGGEAALLDSICVTRAIENECIVAMTNIAGPPFPETKAIEELTESDAVGVGRTCICAPFVGCAGRVESGGEALLLAAIDLRMLQDARAQYKCRVDLRDAWCNPATTPKRGMSLS